MNHNTWWLELTEWHTLPRIKKFATKPGERSEPRWRSRPSQYLRCSKSEATSHTSLPVPSQRELVIFDKNYIKQIVLEFSSNITNSLWEGTGKLVRLVASLLERLRYCDGRLLRRGSLRSPGFVANFLILGKVCHSLSSSHQILWVMSGILVGHPKFLMTWARPLLVVDS